VAILETLTPNAEIQKALSLMKHKIAEKNPLKKGAIIQNIFLASAHLITDFKTIWTLRFAECNNGHR
jgi:hypothetical protein